MVADDRENNNEGSHGIKGYGAKSSIYGSHIMITMLFMSMTE